MEITHLSKTQIGMYQRCPFSWSLRYVEGIKMPPSSSIVLGSSLDAAINLNYEGKIKSGKDEAESVITDCFAEKFDREKGNAVFEESEKPDELKDAGVNTVREFHKTICPMVEPAEVQTKDSIKFDNVPYELAVIVDTVDKNGVVIDNKLAKKSWPAGKEYQELDPVIYSLWYEVNKGKEEQKFRFDIGVMNKTPKCQQIERKVTVEEKQGFLKLLAYTYDSIQHDLKRGVFLPRTDHFLCSRKCCGYHKICEKFWGHRIKD